MATLGARDYGDSLHLTSQGLVYATAAPVLIGFTMATALWGVACAQSVVHFQKQKMDGTRIQRIVAALLLLELVHFALTSHGAYYTLINCRLNIPLLNEATWSLVTQALPSALIVAIVRYVWIMRLWALNRSRARNVMAMIMIALALIEAALTILWITAGLIDRFWGEKPHARWHALTLFLLRVFNDVSIAVSFCYCLKKSKNGFPETDSVITKFIRRGLGVGFFTSFGSVFLVIILFVWPGTSWFLSIYMVLTRVYFNALLATLNWRRQPTNFTRESDVEGIEISTTHWAQTVLSLGGSPDAACASDETKMVRAPESSRRHS